MANRFFLRALTVAGLAVLLSACAGGYSRFYNPVSNISAEDLTAKRVAPAPETPRLARATWSGTDPDVDVDWLIASYARRGYVMIGSSQFNSSKRQGEDDAIAQGRKAGADLVVLLPPRYAGSVTDIEPVDMIGPPGPFFYGPRGRFWGPYGGYWRHPVFWGPGFYGPGMVWAPVTVNYNDYAAFYFVKIRWRFGALYRDLSDAERQDIGSNKGVSISVVVDDSPAFTADLLVGDVITAVNGQAVTGPEDFGRKINDPATAEVTLTIRRDDKTLTKTVKLAG